VSVGYVMNDNLKLVMLIKKTYIPIILYSRIILINRVKILNHFRFRIRMFTMDLHDG